MKPIPVSQTVYTLITNFVALLPVTYKLNLVEDTSHTYSSIIGNKVPSLQGTVNT
jgi:DNA mismatch repair protein MutH